MLSRLLNAWRVNRAYNETKSSLSRLNDRELADIGLSRGIIHEVSQGAALEMQNTLDRKTLVGKGAFFWI